MSTHNNGYQEERFAIVPGEDELMSRPRPGQRPLKTVHWPVLLLALLALCGVAAQAAWYWHDRQALVGANRQGLQQHQQVQQRLAGVEANVSKLESALALLDKQVAAIPQVNPQDIQALEVRVSALDLAIRQLGEANGNTPDAAGTQPNNNAPANADMDALKQQVGALNKTTDSLARQLKTLNYRTSSLEQRVDGISAQVSSSNGSN